LIPEAHGFRAGWLSLYEGKSFAGAMGFIAPDDKLAYNSDV